MSSGKYGDHPRISIAVGFAGTAGSGPTLLAFSRIGAFLRRFKRTLRNVFTGAHFRDVDKAGMC